MTTRGDALRVLTIIVVIIGLNALLWGVLLFLPQYTFSTAASVLVELFNHHHTVLAFGALYIVSSLSTLFGVFVKKNAAIRMGLFLYALLGVYRTIGAFLLNGAFPVVWPSTLGLSLVAAVLWLYYGQLERDNGS